MDEDSSTFLGIRLQRKAGNREAGYRESQKAIPGKITQFIFN